MILSDDILRGRGLVEGDLPKGLSLQVTSDSRQIKDENCFLALYGANFDAIDFVQDVIDKGIEVILIENRNEEKLRDLKELNPDTHFVVVKNIFDFILSVGKERSLRFQKKGGKVIGLTGSNGKTTNKEILKDLLSVIGKEKVHATRGNLNNQIGVPLTLFELEDHHEVAIIEMGTNFPGEIEVLSKCAQPKYGMITNIGYAHIEFLKSLQGVFEEKTALYREVSSREGGVFLINTEDSFLKDLHQKENTLSLSDFQFKISDSSFEVSLENFAIKVANPHLRGKHQKINMAMGMALASTLYPEKSQEIGEKAKIYQPPEMNRGEIRKFEDSLVYLDAYNANPSSMEASLYSFLEFIKEKEKSVCDALPILGDMNELGEDGPQHHEKIGTLLSEQGFQRALFVGRYASSYDKGFGGASDSFSKAEEARNFLLKLESKPSLIFIKGSRSLQLESILDING